MFMSGANGQPLVQKPTRLTAFCSLQGRSADERLTLAAAAKPLRSTKGTPTLAPNLRNVYSLGHRTQRSVMVSRSIRFVSAAAALLLLASLPAAAQDDPFLPEADPIIGGVTRLTDGAGTGGESSPAVAGSARFNRFLVVWSDRRDGELDIYAQKVDAAGARIGTNFTVSSGAAQGGEADPDVVWNPVKKEFLVVWADDRDHPGRGRDIWAQRVLADGTPSYPNFRISGNAATDDENTPAVSVDPVSGRYLVVWSDDRAKASRGADIYGQILNKYGWLVGSNFRLSGAHATGEEYYPAVGADPGGAGFLVAWRDGRVSGGSAIFTQRVKATGKMPGGNVRASGSDAAWPSQPDVASGAAGTGYIVVWHDTRPGELHTDVLGQRMGANGLRKGLKFLVSGTAGVREDEHASVTWDENQGRWMVVWWEHYVFACDVGDCAPPATDVGHVYGRRVKLSGKRAGARFMIASSYHMYTMMEPAGGWSTPAGRHLVVWLDDPISSIRGDDTYGVTLTD